MKTLYKTIKKKWFDMIVSGEKKHEYLEVKPYWIQRLFDRGFFKSTDDFWNWHKNMPKHVTLGHIINQFDTVTCRNGYNPKSPVVVWEHKGITIGEGKSEWGAEPGTKYFILHIGEIISVS